MNDSRQKKMVRSNFTQSGPDNVVSLFHKLPPAPFRNHPIHKNTAEGRGAGGDGVMVVLRKNTPNSRHAYECLIGTFARLLCAKYAHTYFRAYPKFVSVPVVVFRK